MLFVRTIFLENIVSLDSKLLEKPSNSNEILVRLKRKRGLFASLHLIWNYIKHLRKISEGEKAEVFYSMSHYPTLFNKLILWECSAWWMILPVMEIMKQRMMYGQWKHACFALGRTTGLWWSLGDSYSQVKPVADNKVFHRWQGVWRK